MCLDNVHHKETIIIKFLPYIFTNNLWNEFWRTCFWHVYRLLGIVVLFPVVA